MVLTRNRTPKRASGICECGDHAWIVTTRQMFAIFDPSDLSLVGRFNWQARKGNAWWIYTTIEGRSVSLGSMLLGQLGTVDHVDRNPFNNHRRNLRPATKSMNAVNRAKSGTTSRFRGVSRNKEAFIVQIKADRRQYYIGRFMSEEDAARAYDQRARELHGQFAQLNFPHQQP